MPLVSRCVIAGNCRFLLRRVRTPGLAGLLCRTRYNITNMLTACVISHSFSEGRSMRTILKQKKKGGDVDYVAIIWLQYQSQKPQRFINQENMVEGSFVKSSHTGGETSEISIVLSGDRGKTFHHPEPVREHSKAEEKLVMRIALP
ncbi:hypothetical protein IHE44_0000142 [Lamprotornis superbus]|uniref:Uncharacterized protein n=1 Tax=Lamprotornis superbus TaxID=245042 RepID=A0A835U3P0_9PASS|nr:hypothetical protein IHE44_0000142 [Lamprotornis superbus]